MASCQTHQDQTWDRRGFLLLLPGLFSPFHLLPLLQTCACFHGLVANASALWRAFRRLHAPARAFRPGVPTSGALARRSRGRTLRRAISGRLFRTGADRRTCRTSTHLSRIARVAEAPARRVPRPFLPSKTRSTPVPSLAMSRTRSFTCDALRRCARRRFEFLLSFVRGLAAACATRASLRRLPTTWSRACRRRGSFASCCGRRAARDGVDAALPILGTSSWQAVDARGLDAHACRWHAWTWMFVRQRYTCIAIHDVWIASIRHDRLVVGFPRSFLSRRPAHVRPSAVSSRPSPPSCVSSCVPSSAYLSSGIFCPPWCDRNDWNKYEWTSYSIVADTMRLATQHTLPVPPSHTLPLPQSLSHSQSVSQSVSESVSQWGWMGGGSCVLGRRVRSRSRGHVAMGGGARYRWDRRRGEWASRQVFEDADHVRVGPTETRKEQAWPKPSRRNTRPRNSKPKQTKH